MATIEQVSADFVAFYYHTFDTNRAALAALYVRARCLFASRSLACLLIDSLVGVSHSNPTRCSRSRASSSRAPLRSSRGCRYRAIVCSDANQSISQLTKPSFASAEPPVPRRAARGLDHRLPAVPGRWRVGVRQWCADHRGPRVPAQVCAGLHADAGAGHVELLRAERHLPLVLVRRVESRD